MRDVLSLAVVLSFAALLSWMTGGCARQDADEAAGTDTNTEMDTDTDTDTDTDVTTDSLPDGDSASTDRCEAGYVDVLRAETSAVITTVGIIEWQTDIQPVESAYIEFGLTSAYGYVAPADLREVNYRTLLLGMKPSHTYHYRIVVNGCARADGVIETGPPPVNLPDKTVDISRPSQLAPGFIVASTGMKSNYAYILDNDGDYVWWYAFQPDDGSNRMDGIARAKISADGKYMWAGSINVGCGCGRLFRIPMDGIGKLEVIDVDQHHDMTVLPDNSVAYIEYTADGDRIVERSDSGATRVVYQLNADFSGVEDGFGSWSHCNALHYWPNDDSYTVSCLNLHNIIKIDRPSGKRIWTLAGDQTGDFAGFRWESQHGHQVLENGNLLVLFNDGITAGTSLDTDTVEENGVEVWELLLNEETGSVTGVWSYKAERHSAALGDVQRLSNGNTLVTCSLDGIIQEVSPSGQLVRQIFVDGLGYSDWRPSLYGPPARY